MYDLRDQFFTGVAFESSDFCSVIYFRPIFTKMSIFDPKMPQIPGAMAKSPENPKNDLKNTLLGLKPQPGRPRAT